MAKRHQEEAIRKEAVNVLTEIYLRQNVTREFNDTMFRLMASVTLNDLNWEVQIVALNFWRYVIKKQCIERGMIDGKFPSVTFSKEKRKIIVFNDDEIKRQLSNMLDYLSSIGCLTVLDRCLNEEHNVAVMEEAHKIVKELKLLLDDYKFVATQKSICREKNPESRVVEKMEVVNESNGQIYVPHDPMSDFRDMIIDEILNTKQYDLILDIINQTTGHEKEVLKLDNSFLDAELIQPFEFLEKFSSNDYAAIIARKKKFNCDNFSLDDIINAENSTAQQNVIDMCDM